MKHLFIILLVVPALVFGQNKTDKKGQKQGPWEVKFENSETTRYIGQFKDDKPYGKFEYYYASGSVAAVSKFETGGVASHTTMFDMVGNPMGSGKYINQKKDSTWTYFENSTVANREDFKDGQLHGKRIVYYPDGRVYEEMNYENGLKSGTWTMYFGNKQVKATCNFVDGNENGRITYYYSDGKKESVGFYSNAVKNGMWRYYDHRGVVSKEVFYKNDVILLEGQNIKEELDKLKAEGKI